MPLSGADAIAVLALEETDSTNAEAMRRLAGGVRSPLWITADRQTAGRGRSGRSWGTPDGNLAGSLLFFPACPPAALPHLSLVAGVAAFDAVAGTLDSHGQSPASASLRLKWPNDLMAGDAKMAGILIESTTVGGSPAVVIGTGINVAVAPPIPGRAVTSLADLGIPVRAGSIGKELLLQLTRWLGVWDGGRGFAAIRTAWLDRGCRVGERIGVNQGSDRLMGDFAGLDHDGALLLAAPDGSVRRVTFGDVSVGTPQATV